MLLIKKNNNQAQHSVLDLSIMRHLFKDEKNTSFIGIVFAVSLSFFAFHFSASIHQIIVWLSIISMLYMLRIIHAHAYFQQTRPSLAWLIRLRYGTLLTSVAWGASFFILTNQQNEASFTMLILIIIALNIAGTISYSPDTKSLVAFLVPISLMFIIRNVVDNSLPAHLLNIIYLLFLFYLVKAANRSWHDFRANINSILSSESNEKKERAHRHVMEMLAKKEPLEKILNAIVTGIENQYPHMLCSILLLDKNREKLLHVAGPSLPDFYNKLVNNLTIGPNIGSCGAAAFTGKRIIVENIQHHPNWQNYKEIAANAGLASAWSQPIMDSNNQVLGTLAVYHREPAIPNEKEIELINDNAHLASVAIELAHSNKEMILADMFYQSTDEAAIITDANNIIISVNPAFTKVTGYEPEEAIGQTPKLLSSGRHDSTFYQRFWEEIQQTGTWQGELWNRRKNGEVYPQWLKINTIYDENNNVINRISLAIDIAKRKENEEIIWKQANFDALTNLPNRRLFQDRFNMALKKAWHGNQKVALLFIDIDNFKEVNDSLGHPAGDSLLMEAAKRLLDCIDQKNTLSETVSRIGGDEFTIIIEDFNNLEEVEEVAKSILSCLSMPFIFNENTLYVSASIGITVYPDDSTEMITLVKNADQAMYAAKSQGKNQFSYFTESMQINAKKHLELNQALRTALEKNQFELHYQPIVDLNTHHIHKAEALIRWVHPDKGIVNPAEFIAVAEHTGFIIEIGDWVFHQATKQVKKWQTLFKRDFQISINMSPVHFNHSANGRKIKYHENWVEHLKAQNLKGKSIAIEITEGLLLENNELTANQLKLFKDYGIEIALDDFGTGYSSLGYIKKFNVDYIKIDQSFVKNLTSTSEDMPLCEAIIIMAHKLNLKVIAEGIETEDQLALLKAAGCDYGQGYYFSKPLTSDDFMTFYNVSGNDSVGTFATPVDSIE